MEFEEAEGFDVVVFVCRVLARWEVAKTEWGSWSGKFKNYQDLSLVEVRGGTGGKSTGGRECGGEGKRERLDSRSVDYRGKVCVGGRRPD